MNDESKIEQQITRYLLGELSEAEERSIEDKYALDLDFLDRVNAVEEDLVDAYVLRRLTPEQREQFERFFLASPDNRDKVAFAQALSRNIQESNVRTAPASNRLEAPLPPPAWRIPAAVGPPLASFASRFALAALIAMAVGTATWLVVKNRSSQTRVNQASNQTLPSESGTDQLKALSKPPSVNQPVVNKRREENVRSHEQEATLPKRDRTGKTFGRPVVASFILSPGSTRSPGREYTIEIPRNAELVELKLSIDSTVQYTAYRASLQRVGGGEIWSKRIRNSRSTATRSLALKIPANLLSAGEYLLTLTGSTASGGSEVTGDYQFAASQTVKK